MGDRYAVESGCSIVSCNYKKAPEVSPKDIFADAYASLKWVIANAGTLGIDQYNIGVLGIGLGAWVVAGVCMQLARNGEKELIKYQMQMCPHTGNSSLKTPID
jgi:acetyl esterase